MTDINTMTRDEMQAQIAKLMADNARLKAQGQAKLSLKVSEKGALSCYGMGRWPVTLYRGQWERLIEFVKAGHVEAFIVAHSSDLAVKGQD